MKFLRNTLLTNVVIKLVSLVLALFTWTYIAGYLYMEDSQNVKKQAPPIIEVSGKKLIIKRLPIYVNIEGNPAKGYKVVLDKISVNPASSVVAGPPDVIADLSYITTEPINIMRANSTIRKNIRLTQIPNCKVGYDGLVSVGIPIARERHKSR